MIDDFSERLDEILDIARELAPFPQSGGTYYPGLRRIFGPDDIRASAYAASLCQGAAPFIAGAFDVESFNLIEASFSIVTTRPSDLSPPQRAPHFDSTDPKHYALLHYLRVSAGTGTAFYRQRSTGIERVTDMNVAQFVAVAEREAAMLAPDSGYISGSDEFFEQTVAVEAVPDRLLIYQGGLLHSGIIPPAMSFSADPGVGRLTANLFVRGR